MDKIDLNLSKIAFIYGAIYSLSNRMQNIGDKIDDSVTTKQWFILAVIAKFNGIPNIGNVANVLGTSRQNVKKISIILEKKGYLKMQKDENDLRNTQFFLTENCYNYFKSRDKKEEECIQLLFDGISEEIVNSLYCGLNKLLENTGKMKNDE